MRRTTVALAAATAATVGLLPALPATPSSNATVAAAADDDGPYFIHKDTKTMSLNSERLSSNKVRVMIFAWGKHRWDVARITVRWRAEGKTTTLALPTRGRPYVVRVIKVLPSRTSKIWARTDRGRARWIAAPIPSRKPTPKPKEMWLGKDGLWHRRADGGWGFSEDGRSTPDNPNDDYGWYDPAVCKPARVWGEAVADCGNQWPTEPWGVQIWSDSEITTGEPKIYDPVFPTRCRSWIHPSGRVSAQVDEPGDYFIQWEGPPQYYRHKFVMRDDPRGEPPDVCAYAVDLGPVNRSFPWTPPRQS